MRKKRIRGKPMAFSEIIDEGKNASLQNRAHYLGIA
jgi:hypothetical protein